MRVDAGCQYNGGKRLKHPRLTYFKEAVSLYLMRGVQTRSLSCTCGRCSKKRVGYLNLHVFQKISGRPNTPTARLLSFACSEKSNHISVETLVRSREGSEDKTLTQLTA
jgi:hypothetical protein